MRPNVASALLGLGVLATIQMSRADPITFNITTIDVPGSTATTAIAINNTGQIAGSYISAGRTHGFLDTNGVFTTIDVPGSASTQVTGITNVGQILAFYTDVAGLLHVFLDTNGTFSDVDIPASDFPRSFAPGQVAINDAGQMVGTTSTGQAFIYASGQLTFIAPLGPNLTNAAMGINNQGAITGEPEERAGGGTAFVYLNDSYIFFAGGDEGAGYGINNLGDFVYNFGGDQGFPATVLVKNGTFNPLPPFGPGFSFFPGFARGLNDSDEIVGSYDGAFGSHGFLATPVPEPASLLLLGSGLAAVCILIQRRKPSSGNT